MTVANGVMADWAGYSARWKALHGGYDPDRANLPVRLWLRMGYRLARGLARIHVSAALMTLIGLVICLFVPAVATHHGWWPLIGGVLVLVSGLCDTLDGAIAVITGRVTRFGYVYDAVANRVGEAAWLLAYWVVGVPGWVVTLTAALVFLHEYVRSRAIAAGLSGLGVVTVAERPTRVFLSATGLILAGLCFQLSATLAVGAATLILAIWLLLAIGGFLQLFAAVHRGLT
jgi:CDP-diacylglycerol--glycerol-3-phosphate 3-phosphatidyltransferase